MNVHGHRAVSDLTGSWRDEHLFDLGQALELYDTLQQIAVYEQRLEDEVRALTPAERRAMPVPKHPNPAKEKSIRGRGERGLRYDLWRFAEVDLTRIDGSSVGPRILLVSSPAILAVHSSSTQLYRILDTLTHISSDLKNFI